MRRNVAVIVAIVAVILIIGIVMWSLRGDGSAESLTTDYGTASSTKAVPADGASPPDDGNWTMPGKDYA